MLVTDVYTCKQKMSTKGWELFSKHQMDEKNGNPLTWDTKTIVYLNKTEVLQYEYNSEDSLDLNYLLNKKPQVNFTNIQNQPNPEPSLKELIFKYYANCYCDVEAEQMTQDYINSLIN
jgi:hypothetical protein